VGTLRALASLITDPAQLLVELNRRLAGRLQGGFTTCLILRLDAGGACVMASAGHPSVFFNLLQLPPT
jgi:serine phosphatase RsbU (regulator of sigma subunit)